MRVSYSALNDYKTCPLKFKYKNIDKIGEPENAERVFGNLVHDAAEFMFSPNPLYPTLDEIINRFNKNFDEKKSKNGEIKLDRKRTRLNSSHSQISYAVFCFIHLN